MKEKNKQSIRSNSGSRSYIQILFCFSLINSFVFTEIVDIEDILSQGAVPPALLQCFQLKVSNI